MPTSAWKRPELGPSNGEHPLQGFGGIALVGLGGGHRLSHVGNGAFGTASSSDSRVGEWT
ncbi:MAG: hypothetical protein M3321_00135 [Actinomycetota bacterium]|nr:hypothetical protein [Actinomycetota bacterium]